MEIRNLFTFKTNGNSLFIYIQNKWKFVIYLHSKQMVNKQTLILYNILDIDYFLIHRRGCVAL